MPTSWTELFERAEAYEIDLESVRRGYERVESPDAKTEDPGSE